MGGLWGRPLLAVRSSFLSSVLYINSVLLPEAWQSRAHVPVEIVRR
jgi:hypothetical protein